MVQAWRAAPPSTAKRLLAMAAATPLQGAPVPDPAWQSQALLQAGPWLQQSAAGRRLREPVGERPGGNDARNAPGVQLLAEPAPDAFWLWAA
jgi:hypothetical protein